VLVGKEQQDKAIQVELMAPLLAIKVAAAGQVLLV
jgi:hypothetical protein